MNSMAIVLVCLMLVTVILLSSSILWHKADHYSEGSIACGVFSGFAGLITLILMCISFTYPLEPRDADTVALDNDKNVPIKVSYLQYHMYIEPTMESVVLMPGQIKVVNHAKVIKMVKFDYTTDSL